MGCRSYNQCCRNYSILFLMQGVFPSAWCNGLITPIFKSGRKSDPGNYRGICVTSCLGKLFCSILNSRIAKHLNRNNPIDRNQIGFQPGSRTSDHLLTLKVLQDNFVKSRSRGKIFACFVGFRKALDSMWHKGLFLKLLQSNVGGNVYDSIKDVFNKSHFAVKVRQNTSTKALFELFDRDAFF